MQLAVQFTPAIRYIHSFDLDASPGKALWMNEEGENILFQVYAYSVQPMIYSHPPDPSTPPHPLKADAPTPLGGAQ